MVTTPITINNPTPTITSMFPVARTHSVMTSVTLTGTNFISGAKVKLKLTSGSTVTTYTPTSLTPTQITVTIPGGDIPAAGSYDIWVANPAPPSPDDSAHWVFAVN